MFYLLFTFSLFVDISPMKPSRRYKTSRTDDGLERRLKEACEALQSGDITSITKASLRLPRRAFKSTCDDLVTTHYTTPLPLGKILKLSRHKHLHSAPLGIRHIPSVSWYILQCRSMYLKTQIYVVWEYNMHNWVCCLQNGRNFQTPVNW
jgi:hypothetical protein